MHGSKKVKLNSKKTAGENSKRKIWIINIIFTTFILSTIFSFISEVLLRNVEILVAFVILILIISIGIIFDIIGTAVTAAEEMPFHSMASRKIFGAKTSIYLIRNAGRISNLCNDVVGDVCGIVSGAVGTAIAERLLLLTRIFDRMLLTIMLSSGIASVTVGGKAIGKHFAISEANNIIYAVGCALEKVRGFFHRS